MKFNKILFNSAVMLIVLLSVGLVSSALDDAELYYSFDDDDLSGSNPLDLSGNSYTATNNGATTGITGKLNEAFNYDGSNDYVETTYSRTNEQLPYTYCVWVTDYTTSSSWQSIIERFTSGLNANVRLGITDTNKFYYTTGDGAWDSITGTTTVTSGEFYHLCAVWTGTNKYLYVDGTSEGTSTPSTAGKPDSTGVNIYIGARNDGTSFWDGKIEELGYWERELSSTEIIALYNSDSGFNPYATTTTTDNHVELAFTDYQPNPTSFWATNSWNQIMISQITNTENTSYGYLDLEIQMSSLNTAEVECKLEVNNNLVMTGSRTNLAGTYGSLSMLSGNLTFVGNQTYNMSVFCKKNSAGLVTIETVRGVAHYLNQNISFDSYNWDQSDYTYSQTYGGGKSSYQKTIQYVANYTGNLIIDSAVKVTDNIDNEFTYQITTDNVDCSKFLRDINAYKTGSIGASCSFNVTEGVTYNITTKIECYDIITDLSATFSNQLHFKLLDISYYNKVGAKSVSDSDLLLSTLNYDNSVNAYDKIFIKSSLSMTDSGNEVSVYYTINGVSTNEIIKTASSNNEVGIIHYLDDITTTSYEIKLYARSNNGIVTINDGDFIIYPTNEFSRNITYFDVTTTNFYNSSSLSIFNVTISNITVSATDGSLIIYTSEDFLNLIVESPNYISKTIVNHNTSNDLSVDLYQSVMWVNITEQLSGNPINNWALLNGSTVLINTTTNIGVFYPNAGEFNNLVLKSNIGAFSDRSIDGFNVSYLEQNTIFYELFPTELTITAVKVLGGATINDFTVYYDSLNNEHSGSYSTTSGSIVLGVVNNDDYNITIDADGYALYNNSKIISVSGNTAHEFELYTNNSINIEVRWENNNSLVEQNTFLTLTGGVTAYNFSTSTGLLYVDNIIDGTYSIKAQTNNNDVKYYSISVGSRSYQELGIYFDSNYNNVTFLFQDANSGENLKDVYFTMNRYINGSLTLVSSKLSDITGTVKAKYVPEIFYMLSAIKDDYAIKNFDLDPIESNIYIVKLETDSGNIFIDDNVAVFYDPKIFSIGNNIMTLGIVSPLGFLTSSSFIISYPGGNVTLINNNISNGRTWYETITIINPSLYDVVNVTYSYTTSVGTSVSKTFYHTINYANATSTAWSNSDDLYSGLGIFERIIIVMLAVVLVAGFGFLVGGASGSIFVGLITLVFFVATGFIPLWSILISLLVGLVLMLRGGIFG